MDLILRQGSGLIKDYLQLIGQVYSADPHYRKTMLPVLGTMTSKKSAFLSHAEVVPTMIYWKGNPVAASLFITTPKLPGVLQLAFFEALPDCQDAVDLLIQFAKERCTKEGLRTLFVGMNGHVNYGLGFLADKYASPPCFGSAYNPWYYAEYFRALGMEENSLVSYLADMSLFTLKEEEKLLKRAGERYQVRTANFNKLSSEVEIYTRLNNQCFSNHLYYYERTVAEDYELLKGFRPLIRDENLLVVEEAGEPVGFMLWYPDFHQVIPPGKGFDPITFLKLKLYSNRIDRFKIAEIGVLPRHQGTGAVALLFQKCYEIVKDRYSWCETSWILAANSRSRGFGIRWADSEYKRYSVFEMPVAAVKPTGDK